MPKYSAFTLIELVIVIVLLGILSAIALPKYFNLSEDAEKARVKTIYHQFITGINNAHLKYEISQNKTYIDYDNDGVDDLYFRDELPYPIGGLVDAKRYRVDPSSAGIPSGNNACGAIFQHLLKTDYTVETFGPACYESKHKICTISFYDVKGFGCYYVFSNESMTEPKYGFSYFVDLGEPYFFLFHAPKEAIEWWSPDLVVTQGNQSYILEKTGAFDNLFMERFKFGLDGLEGYYGASDSGESKLSDLSKKIAENLSDDELSAIMKQTSKNSLQRYKEDIAESLDMSPENISDEWAQMLYESHNFIFLGAQKAKEDAQ